MEDVGSSQHFGVLFRDAAIGIALVNLDGQPVRSNDALQVLLGYTEAELATMAFPAFTHPDDLAADWALYQELIGGKRRHYQIVKRFIHKSGAIVWTRLSVSLVGSDPVQVVAMVEDRTAAHDQQVEQERLIWTLGERVKELTAVHEIARILQREETPIGEVLSLVAAALPPAFQFPTETFARVSLGDLEIATPGFSPELPRLRVDYATADGIGLVIEVAQRPAPAFLAEEQALLRSVVDLVGGTLDRRALADRLRQAQKLEAIGGLAAGIAHDFNNILSVVIGYAAMVREDLGDHPLAADIKEIEAAGNRAADLTRQLLAFSRRQLMQPRTVDLGAIVAGLDKMLHRLLGEDIELSIRQRGDIGTVFADPNQIEQVVLNLVVNARDAMPGGGKLTIECVNADPAAVAHLDGAPGSYVMLVVSDTGSGMTADVKARAFEPFFTTKPTGRGTGLGLATVFGIVRQSGGTISLESEPGRGTTFRIYLPHREQPVDEPIAAPQDRTLRGTERVLLVEDDPQVRDVARALLQRNGYTVFEARNGGEAMLISEREPEIDLLLTDLVMPLISGRELATRLLAVRPHLKVLYMSGYTDDAIVHRGVLDASLTYVQKPLSPESLLPKLREALDTR